MAKAPKPQKMTVKAGPTKRFFVEMLTRDIDLEDAILDLLDNCIDGILRQTKGSRKSKRPYEGFYAKITATAERFCIEDNCGGIPRDIAINSAFRLGRPDSRDGDIETVGMYGIGMKRAIFKMGRKCSVVSQPKKTKAYLVSISPSWFKKDDEWNLPLKDTAATLQSCGTKIEITQLLDVMKTKFNEEESTFLDELRTQISELFALIIDKGFKVYVNDVLITGVETDILAPNIVSVSQKTLAPYAFKGRVQGVHVEVVVGFYRGLATEKETDPESRPSRKHAGWTIICNDRIVLYGDKSRLTGWNSAAIPAYHNQFISIRGVAKFTSTNSLLLPINTTKRGIDASSTIYLYVLDIMKEGMKQFITYTNRWKTRTDETRAAFEKLKKKKTTEILEAIPKSGWKSVRKGGEQVSAKKYIPDLPKPPTSSANASIRFSRRKSDIETVGEYLFSNGMAPPNDVGARCFDEILKEAEE